MRVPAVSADGGIRVEPIAPDGRVVLCRLCPAGVIPGHAAGVLVYPDARARGGFRRKPVCASCARRAIEMLAPLARPGGAPPMARGRGAA